MASHDFLNQIASLVGKDTSWVNTIPEDDEGAFLRGLSERVNSLTTQSKVEVEKAQTAARQAAIRTQIVIASEQIGIDLPSPVTSPNEYARRINMLASLPEFDATTWAGSGKDVYPIDETGNHRNNHNFSPATVADLLEDVNPFGLRSGKDKKQVGKTPEQAKASYLAQREKLAKAGDKKGLLALSRKFAASQTA